MATDTTLAETRRSLHGVAELLLAGPQHAVSGTIRLRALPDGFGTTREPDVRVVGTELVLGNRRTAIDGSTIQRLGDALGITPSDLSQVYADGSGVGPEDGLRVEEDPARRIAAAYALGDAALRRLAPDQAPVLWPEHFDIAVTTDQVNYGVSPGDSFLPAPYMYVGPWTPPPVDDFWDQPFGAARALPDAVDDVVAFFEEARARLSR